MDFPRACGDRSKIEALEKLARHVGLYDAKIGDLVIVNPRQPLGGG